MGRVFRDREIDAAGFQATQLWYWMLQTRAYWRLEEVFGYSMDDWALGVRW
ncbi:MAG: hypothetical protein N3G75_06230 [Methanothrix sp.]|nr:hypothetical protein [Methanothrix sp.]MCX8207412.1 hypothetical protein [Methanothrix sp.]